MDSNGLSSPAPIFILGVTERSGTSFLYHLLCLHPDCIPGTAIWEDYFLKHSNFLENYVQSVSTEWNATWDVSKRVGPPELLLRFFGDSIISYLERQRSTSSSKAAARLVTKTPSVRNLGLFFRLFPTSRLLILVRDGRAVVTSGMQSFDWRFEEAARDWRRSAATILEFDRSHRNEFSDCYRVIRFEDLFTDTAAQLTNILRFLDLDPTTYDFEAADKLPVVGTSELRKTTHDEVHWEGEPRTQNFNPLTRWRCWSRYRHKRFNWLAGEEMAAFQYPLEQSGDGCSFLWQACNVTMDLYWQFVDRLRRYRARYQRRLLSL